MPARIVWEVVEVHLDEAEYLAGAFEKDLDAHHSTIHDVAAGSERRLLAHVDGVVVAGEPAVARLLEPAIADGPIERAQAAAMARLASDYDDGLAALWPTMIAAESPHRASLFRGLALTESITNVRIRDRLGKHGAEIDASLLRTMADRGASVDVAFLRSIFDGRDEPLMAAALEVARYAEPTIPKRGLTTAVEAVQTPASLAVAVLQSLPFGWPRVRALAAEPGPLRRAALELLAAGGMTEDYATLRERFEDPSSKADALWALGYSGAREVIDLALAHLGDEALGGLAAEALVAITGVDARQEKLLAARKPEPETLPPLEEDDLEADLAPKVEDTLPRLDPEATLRWWKKQERRFPRGTRYLYGEPYQPASFRAAFDRASTRRRRVLALELGIRSQGRLHLATRAATDRQAKQLAALTA